MTVPFLSHFIQERVTSSPRHWVGREGTGVGEHLKAVGATFQQPRTRHLDPTSSMDQGNYPRELLSSPAKGDGWLGWGDEDTWFKAHLFPLRSADGQSEQVSWCQFPSSPSDISAGSTINEQQTTASPQVHQSRSGTPLPPTLSFAQELALGFSVFLHGFPPSHSQFIRWDCDQITAFNSHRCVLPKFVQLLWTCVGLLLPQSPAARSSSRVRQWHTGKG